MSSRALSARQRSVLAAVASLGPAPARTICIRTGQSSDGCAYTLRSLVRRGLVAVEGNDGSASGYVITPAGSAEYNRQ